MAVSSTSVELDAKSNANSYSELTSASKKDGQWQSALYLSSFMHQANVVPTTVSRSAAINACERGCQWVSDLHLFKLDAPGKGSARYNLFLTVQRWQSALYSC
eukprot:TRINITY_DN18312_c0_g1_i3.p2 TRINITY_DN18312_c0_g1~~TRINITY_DN18312_c0_g1_i3.p2  ORF type:complete len:103 (+),score=17.01 TRINITY_DN18312_c0_g1_i3:162-470(+)